jgi:hypothetical protein
MARVKDGGQSKFEDKPLMDSELADACEAQLENKAGAVAYRKANQAIKARLPGCTEPTRFCIGERYFIEVTPYSVDGHEVSGGERQRVRVLDAASS